MGSSRMRYGLGSEQPSCSQHSTDLDWCLRADRCSELFPEWLESHGSPFVNISDETGRYARSTATRSVRLQCSQLNKGSG